MTRSGFSRGVGFDLVLLRSFQKAVRIGREFVGSRLEGVVCLEPEDETDVARIVPSIQMLGLGEFGVSSHQDLAEASLTAKRDRLVQVDVSQLLRGTVAAAIEQEQRFGGVGQRDQERMVTVLAVVGEVHPLLALRVARNDGAIGVQNCFLKELGLAAGPRPAGGID